MKRQEAIRDKFWRWVSYRLPRRLAYFAVIRVWAYATTGKFANLEAPSVTTPQMLDAWEGGTK